ncbi:cilia- and flagella-associated protein 43 [Brachionichthys hirsutus]|uniref:cilia- and flagella-associated protein 43 n=1 Tax=Brachionichthys hirsutus TaxID=412623 RepID=UPI0036045E95
MDDILVCSIPSRWSQGFTDKHVEFVDCKTVCYKCGNHVCFLNLDSKWRRVLHSPGRGAGAFTANGKDGIFGFSEQKMFPSIFVYSYPDFQLKNELKGTAQTGYTSLTFSNGGPYLGCCSSHPDHTITVWNWETAEPICAQPEAGCDVTSLVFNPLNCLQLCAFGSTSLTVWTIEKSSRLHLLKPRLIDLPAQDGSCAHRVHASRTDSKQSYLGPAMPPSAISGLTEHNAGKILAKLCTKARLTPTAICWKSPSELFVGCAEGFLLLVDTESLSVSISFDPTTADAIPELRRISFQGLAFNKYGLIAVGEESVAHRLQIEKAQINIAQTWRLEGPVSAVTASPDNETVALSSDTGQIYTLNPAQPDHIVKVLDHLRGNFVAATLLPTNKNICVSVKDSGGLQLWTADGASIGSLLLQAEVTSLACCPVAQYAAVGTAAGNVLFVDLNKEQQPRLVHRVHLYHTSVDQLVFDQEGRYLLTAASDSRIYVLDAKPSNQFSCIGYTVAPGPILSLSTQCIGDDEEVKVLALCTGQKEKHPDGSLLAVFCLPKTNLRSPDCVDRYGRLSVRVLRGSRFEVPDPLQSCVLGVSKVFAYCNKRKSLQTFQLPKDTGSVSDEEAVQLKPQQEVKGHLLGPASLVLSPHQLWLASVGRDGLLRVRESASMENYIELRCNSHRDGGAGSVSFSADSQTLITTGYKDGSLLCSRLRIKDADADQMKKAAQHTQSTGYFLKNIFSTENPVLIGLPDWGQRSPADTEKAEETNTRPGAETVDVMKQDDILSAAPSHPTWRQSRREAVIKEDNEQYSEETQELNETLKEIRDTILEMIRENENVPEIERLELKEFNVDVDHQKRLDAMVEQEVTRVKNEIKSEIAEKRDLRDVLRNECWDSLIVKSKAIKGFHSEQEVKNYPLKQRTKKEMDNLHQVEKIRKIEKAACMSDPKRSSGPSREIKEEQKEILEAGSHALTGSISAELGYSNPYIYDQFSLKTTEQKINQTVLLQDLIRSIKAAFNAEFDNLHKQKMQELNRVTERNKRIKEIMLVLDIDEKLWEPSLSIWEQPERFLTVDDSEIKVEKYLSPEQKEQEEQRKKSEEQRLLAANVNNSTEKGLKRMMCGVLEKKKEDILKVEIPPPKFTLNKPDTDWSEEEKRTYKDYENKMKDLKEEKEKFKKSLENEMTTLQTSSKDSAKRFDEKLRKLFEKKLKCEMAMKQEELKISYLIYSVQIEQEIENRELELKLKLEKAVIHKAEIVAMVKEHEKEVQSFHDTYDGAVAEDKTMDKEFRKEFFDAPNHVVDHLYKLFKRRPRFLWMNSGPSFLRFRAKRPLPPDALGNLLTAMEELDAPENMPEGLDPSVWKRFCQVRRIKVESELKLKLKALSLAEMKAFQQRRIDEERVAQLDIQNIADELESLHKEKNHFLTNLMVQVLLKQDQVEVPPTDLTVDFSDSVLLHRKVVEDLNSSIGTLGEKQIASMVKYKHFRKGIVQLQWEHKKMNMQIEDLEEKERQIKLLKLGEDQQKYLNKSDRQSCVSKQISNLEETIAFKEKTHLRNVQHRIEKIEQLKMQAAKQANENAALDRQLCNMEMTVAEMRNIHHESTASEESQAAQQKERYQEMLQRKKLKDLARAQAEELAFLEAELDRLRMKNFPSLAHLK